MTAQEKNTLYSLIKTVSDYCCGYSSPDLSIPPVFTDDPVSPAAAPAAAKVSAAVQAAAAPQAAAPAASVPVTMQDISRKIASCMRCQLAAGRTHVVPGEGVLHPVVLVIGEGPGPDEDVTGRPFVGPAGQLLDKMLAAISLDRHRNCFIGNVVKCRPPHNRDPEPAESQACRAFLDAQIHLLKPAMILAVGRIASQLLLNTQTGIGALRGSFHQYNSIPLLATYHPSALLRNADLKRPAWEDLKLFRTRLQTIVPGYETYTDTFYTPADVQQA